MSVNIEDSFEIIQEGFAMLDEDGNRLLYITSKNGDPTGDSAPINTWVFRQDTQTLYYKFGAGDNDWGQFDPENIPAQSINIFQYFREDEENTNSNGFVTYHQITTPTLEPAEYILDWTHQLGQSDKNKKVGSRVEWREGTSGGWNRIYDEADGVSVDDGFVPKTSFAKIVKTTSSVLQVRDRFGDTDEGGQAGIKGSGFKITRVEDLA